MSHTFKRGWQFPFKYAIPNSAFWIKNVLKYTAGIYPDLSMALSPSSSPSLGMDLLWSTAGGASPQDKLGQLVPLLLAVITALKSIPHPQHVKGAKVSSADSQSFLPDGSLNSV